MKKLFYPLMLATAFVATSCTNTEDTNTTVDPSGKTPISFVGENNTAPITRAGFTDNTEVVMHIRSVSKKDDKTLETLTFANAEKPVSGASFSNVAFTQPGDYRYWDDAHGRDSKLSVFAIAVPNKSSVKNADKYLKALLDGNETWADKGVTEDVKWTVSATQTDDILNNEDLVYSNNIQADKTLGIGGVNSSNSTVTNGELQFRLTDTSANADSNGPGKFDEGRLNFTHALSRITVNLTKSDGFTENSKFEFTSANGNVSIPGVPTSGTLNLETGTWTQDEPTTGINSMSVQSSSADKHSLMAQMLPGYEIRKAGTSANMLSFEIDNNQYFVTQAQMYEALTKASEDDRKKITIGENSIVMEKGINYVFNINVKKTGVAVTATVVEFDKVTAGDINKDNSHGELTFNTTGKSTDDFKLFRLEDSSHTSDTKWFGKYSEAPDLKKDNGVWKTGWFFENDAAYYHFRAVSSNVTVKNSTGTDGDYFTIESGKESTNDYLWGAPMVVNATISYDKEHGNGYASAISNAIRSTTSTINLTELHMMSSIHIVLRTTTGKDAVVLEDEANDKKCKVNLTNFYEKGKVNMGNGLVTITSKDLTSNMPFAAPAFGTEKVESDTRLKLKKPFTLYVVPQEVKRSGDAIGLTITTPDGNVYTVNDLSASTSTLLWEPNHEYTYTFTLTKTGVVVTCTVEEWVPVSAGSSDISLAN